MTPDWNCIRQLFSLPQWITEPTHYADRTMDPIFAFEPDAETAVYLLPWTDYHIPVLAPH